MSKDYISVAFSIYELQALHAALRDKISNLKADHLFVKQYRHMLEGADLKIKLAANTVFGASRFDEAMHSTMMKKNPDLNTAIDVAYRTTIELAQKAPVEFVCGPFDCGECRERMTCDTTRTAQEWEQRYETWKESTHATDKNKR